MQTGITRRSLLGMTGSLGALASLSQAAPSAKPNIIVIVADDLGYADVGFNGCRDYDTPHLDSLAASGVRFVNGYVTHPYCSPSRAGLLTGRYQQRFGHESNPDFSPDDSSIGTPLSEVFLPEVLRRSGYRTGAVGKWHLGDAPAFLPHRRGFDEFFGFSGGGFNYYGIPNKREARNVVMRNGEPVPAGKLSYLTDDFSEEAVSFVNRNRQNPFFLYLAYNAPHAPNQAPQKYLDRASHIEYGSRSVYAAMTMAMDDGIGRVVKTLEANRIRENTLVFFVSDNGGRHDGADNRPLRGHKGILYDGGIRVPFLFSWPARLAAGKTYAHPVSALDLFPTALAAAGERGSPGKPLDGVDLTPFLTGANRLPPHDSLHWRVIGGQGYAVRQGRYKLVKRAATGRTELFDLEVDPNERRDIALERPQVLAELQRLHERWNAQMIPPLWTDGHPANVRKEYEAVIDARKRALPPQR